MFKRGISGLVVSVLVILIALVATSTIWIVVSDQLNSASSSFKTSDCITTDLSVASCTYDASNVAVLLKRGESQIDVTGAKFVFESSGESKTIEVNDNLPQQLGARQFTFSTVDVPNPSSVSVAALLGEITCGTNNQVLCNPASNLQLSSVCFDGLDNDVDGWTDMEDPACYYSSNPSQVASETYQDDVECSNEADDDGDHLVDGFDPACRGRLDLNAGENLYYWDESHDDCFDGLDNDDDGADDADDFSCQQGGAYENSTKAQCQDGIDNDFDGLTDYPNDADCSSSQDDFEYSESVNEWQKINGQNPIDAGEETSLVTTRTLSDKSTTLKDSSGNLIYVFQKQNPYGAYIGRFNVASKAWEILTFSGWSGSSTSMVKPFSENRWTDSKVNLVENTPNNFIGVIGSSVVEGGVDIDIHDRIYSFKFNASSINYWSNENNYSSGLVTPLSLSYDANNKFASDMDYNGAQILSVSKARFPSENSTLTAAKYDFSSNVWKNWDQGQWKKPTLKIKKASALKLPFAQTSHQEDSPVVTSIPGGSFIITYLSSTTYSSNRTIRAAKYDSVADQWSWWKTSGWSFVGTPDDIITGISSISNNYRKAVIANNKLYTFFEKQNSEKSEIYFVSYDLSSQSWSSAQKIAYGEDYVVQKDSSGNIWLIYAHNGVLIETRFSGSSWSQHNIIYNSTENTALGSLDFIGNNPLLMISEETQFDRYRLFALSDTSSGYWNGEATRNQTLPAQVKLDLSHGFENNAWGTTIKINVSYTSYPFQDYSQYGDVFCGHLSLDSEGKVYCPKVGVNSVGIFPGNYTKPANNELDSAVSWGGYWDYFDFPSSATIDNSRDAVYITDHITEGDENDENISGQIQIWRKSWNNISIIEKNSTYDIIAPRLWNIIVINKAESNHYLNWPDDSAVDESRGILYVTETSYNRVLKYNVTNPDSVSFLGAFGTFGTGNGQFNAPKGIDIDNSGNVYVVDSRNHRVQKFDSNNNFITQIGSFGTGSNHLIYPYAISVDKVKGYVYVADAGNAKIEIFDINGNPVYSFGVWDPKILSTYSNRDFKRIGGLAVNNNKLYVSVQGKSSPSPQIVAFQMNLP